MNCLLYLKDVYDIKWNDVHEANVMMRPKTGDFVISDSGLFEMNYDGGASF